MKSVTEFNTLKLAKGVQAKKALAAEGKTPEEIQASIGESFKLEGDKLKLFVDALDVADQNMEKLSRILVITLADGESIPAKAVKVDGHYFVPEFQGVGAKPVLTKAVKGGGQGRGKDKEGSKSSRWGLSPEEQAAKNKSSAAKPAAK